MFETTAVESRRRRHSPRSTVLLPASVGLHLFAVAAATFAAVWDVEFPRVPPAQMQMLVVQDVPKAPAAARARTTTDPKPKATAQPKVAQNVAPQVIPDVIPQNIEREAPRGAVENSVDDGSGSDGRGLIGGFDGGDPDSVLTDEPQIALAPVPVGGEVKAPVIVKRIDPVYPALMQKIRKPGRVVVQCIIDHNGTIQNVAVVDATNELFAAAATEAVRQWKFRPGTHKGRPLDVIYHLTVTFNMAD